MCRSFEKHPDRLRHILTVARKVRETAQQLSAKYPEMDLDVNVAYCAALLHDIGYLDALTVSGFHPIDGANYLRECGYPDLAEYILGHSNSPEQATLLQIEGVVMSPHIIAKLITYWDIRVRQGGALVSYAERLDDIKTRYGVESQVWKSHLLAHDRISQLVQEIEDLL